MISVLYVHNWWEYSGDELWATNQISSPKATNVITAVIEAEKVTVLVFESKKISWSFEAKK